MIVKLQKVLNKDDNILNDDRLRGMGLLKLVEMDKPASPPATTPSTSWHRPTPTTNQTASASPSPCQTSPTPSGIIAISTNQAETARPPPGPRRPKIYKNIAASDLKVVRCRQLIEFMKLCEYRRSRSFLYHIFSRFCMFCALLGQGIR